jgi:hypothetical protein
MRHAKLLPLAITLALCLNQCIAVLPARAQFPYWYLYAGQSLLYPLTRGLLGSLYYGPYNANPLYSASYFMKRAASTAAQYPYIPPYYSPGSFGPYGYRNAGLPPNYNYGLNNQDLQSNPNENSMYSQPIHLPQTSYQPQSSPYYPPMQNNVGSMPSGTVLSGGAQQNYKTVPPIAPPTFSAPPVMPQAPTSITQAAPNGQGSAPLAQGFVDHLNNNYQGDIGKALGDNDTRNWAKAMGLFSDGNSDISHVPSDRMEVIGRILKDNSLDPVSKIDTVRILLRKQ